MEKRKDAVKAEMAKSRKRKESGGVAKEFQDYRVRMSARCEKFYVGDFQIPTAVMKRPPHTAAARSYNEQHTCALAEEMWTCGIQFPIKPCVICCFNVHSSLRFILFR